MCLDLETSKQQQKHYKSTKQQQNTNGGYKETNKNNLKMEVEKGQQLHLTLKSFAV